MRKILQFIIIGSLSFLWSEGRAQAPTWNVNPGDYEYSMTVTAILKIDDVLSNDEADRVAAFINGEVRGFGHPSFYVPAYDAMVVYLQIYSNKITGDEVTFRIYDQSDNEIISALNQLPFTSDVNHGTTGSPYVITTNATPAGLVLTTGELNENLPTGTIVGTFNTPLANAACAYTLVAGTGADDNGSFRIDGDKLLTQSVFDYESKASYSIRVQTENALGGTLQKQFTITISNTNDAPTDLRLSRREATQQKPAGTVVGILSATDADTDNSLSYSLVPGSGDMGNDSFFIDGDSLKTAAVFDYKTQPWYSVRVMADDGHGGTVSQAFTIYVTLSDNSNVTGIEELLADGVRAYPNPVADDLISLTLPESLEGGASLSIIGLDGKLYSKTFIQGAQYQVQLPPVKGILILKIEKDKAVVFKRVVKY